MSNFSYSLLLVPLLGACTINKDLLATGAPDTTYDGAASEPAVTTGETTTTGDVTATENLTDAVDPVTTTGSDLDTGDSFTTTQDTEVDTEGCDTGCVGELDPCVRALAWDDGLIGMTVRPLTNCDGCGDQGTVETLLVRIDVDSNAMTVFGAAGFRSDGNAMVIADDGAIFVGGHLNAVEFEDMEVGQLHKFSPEGALLWSVQTSDSAFSDLALRGDELLVTGRSGELQGRSVTDGALLWDIPRDHTGVVLAGVEVDGTGAFYVVGGTNFDADNEPLHTMFIRKYAADRTLLWEDVHTPPLPTDYIDAEGLVLDEAGGVIIATREYVLGQGTLDLTTFRKYDAAGVELWAENYPEIGKGDDLRQLRARPGGGAIAVGRGGSMGGGLGGFTVALGPDGDVLWSDRKAEPQLGGQRNNDVVAVDGTLLITGCAYDEVTIEPSSWLLERTP